MKNLLYVLSVVLFLTACTHKATEPPSTRVPLPEFPPHFYQDAPNGDVFTLDAGQSYADILVRRGGSLARMGHDHVVTAVNLQGFVYWPTGQLAGSRADLRSDLNALEVDEASRRQRYHLDTTPSEEDIRKTSENMHLKVLNSKLWPETQLSIKVTGGTFEAVEAQLGIHLHGQFREMPIVFSLSEDGGEKLTATGEFTLRQSDFGIQPYQVLGGALKVEDEVNVHFHIEALPGR